MPGLHTDLPSLPDLSRYNARKSPTSIAFEDANGAITWSEFDEQSDAVARGLAELVTPGDRIAFLSEASVPQAVALMGGLKTGGITSHLHTRAPDDERRYFLDQLEPRVLIVDREHAGQVDRDITTFTLSESGNPLPELPDPPDGELLDVSHAEDDVASIFWTSGSTGRPTGWCHSYRSLYVKAMKMAGRTGVDPGGMALTAFSPSFGAWFNVYLKALIGAESAYFLRNWDPQRWLEVVESRGITFTGLVVTMWREVLAAEPTAYDLGSLEVVYTTGEQIDPETLDRIRSEICDCVFQTYGSTEMTGTALYNHEMQGERIESVGKPQLGSDLRIIDPDGDPDDECEPGEVGEIIIRGPDVPTRAWRDEDRTREAFRNGWWYSKDLGYRDEVGYVYLEGRADSMIKSRGMKVIPERVESALSTHPDVDTVVVVGVDDEAYGQRVTAIVQGDADLTGDALETWCLDHDALGRYERPRSYVFTDEIARTPSGKVDRRATKQAVDLGNL